ncbi:hypothetical protein B9Z55_009874 [Caenorhabditis nigoni]|uniref:Uncharacterized protein n=1 Tax=Caenorhabditis nigoni TaxID=1611254 RepID=A0A2G5UTU9_9PELO|nr:hypothetical protein B9Z55_009874 [Caenorhabditis nigoni]
MTSIVTGVELTIFFASLAFYHFCIFRKKLSKEIERMRLEAEKLERITKGVPEPEELLSPTQKSSILEAESTQLSEKEEPKQKKKPLKKTKSVEKKKEKEKKEKKKENKKKTLRKTSNLRLSLEDTQRDDYDTGPPGGAHIPPFNPLLVSPPTQESYYDNSSLRQERSPAKVVSETDQPRTCSPANEKSVYSPKLHPTQEKSLESHVDDADMRTAREDLWN